MRNSIYSITEGLFMEISVKKSMIDRERTL